ncbi:metal-binding protein [Mucilaginibacter terrenus]|uniref:Metal-binding protein n=1 Tax=Mucilaginibacter terrenus TaxID=2482727 RepID=A0A3E2NMC5_9SPHI|nr:Ada metal-binding domain-containing protein [Mucilaginibacter terrenus]RFZ82155.1 metal-binding protein [Mucilaginibacter terrenus]
MITHTDLGDTRFIRAKCIRQLLGSKQIELAGNRKLKIYGTLSCASGKRMKAENRVFFKDELEAVANGYRPCGHCLRAAYHAWRRTGTQC